MAELEEGVVVVVRENTQPGGHPPFGPRCHHKKCMEREGEKGRGTRKT